MQRKVFRIERTFGGRLAAKPIATAPSANAAGPKTPHAHAQQPDAADGIVDVLERELALLHAAVAQNMRELAALIGSGDERRMAHAAGKLGAAVEGMEKATVKILKSTEAIDDAARALAAALKTDYERGLTQDIQEHVVKIYEACNFQDLSGQRIGHVIETLNTIEDRVEAIIGRHDGARDQAAAANPSRDVGLINGPRLDGASGHTSQGDIDILFD